MQDIVHVIKNRAQKHPESKAILYLDDGINPTANLSFYELDQQAKIIASALQSHLKKGDRVVLLYPAGIEFVTSLIGCWYAGVVAVPIPCPKIDEFPQHKELLNTIAEDADIAAVLCLNHYRVGVEAILKKVPIFALDALKNTACENYQPVTLTGDCIAYLQYTSGSTSTPKAAIITHGNLQHSLQETLKAWHYTKKSVTLNWAPHTHVYGLVCGILVPLYHGSLAIIMPPARFINKPVTWLSAISRYRVTHSGCPNFGYDMCVRDIEEHELAALDLKHWKVAINGGDIVQLQTLINFTNKFKACGFELKQFCSAYGMSELTGAIAVTPYGREPRSQRLQGTQRQLVSSGKLLGGLAAIAVDPATGHPVSSGEIGEIWLSGNSLAHGYWQRPDENREVFQATVPGSTLHYFKSGDLGFILDNEIYLTGRLKEVIVIYGKKYYPLDLEITVAKAVSAYQVKLPQVVFSTEIAGKEKIIVIQELAAETPPLLCTELKGTIRHAITKHHGIDVYEVVLSPKGAIPKTGSGKLQRKKAQLLFHQQRLETLNLDLSITTADNNKNTISTQLTKLVAKVLQIDEKEIDLHAPLSRYSFDSITIIQLTNLLNDSYGLSLSPATLYEYATLAEFCRDLLEKHPVERVPTDKGLSSTEANDIAIIGMSGIFPQAPDVDTFWENLSQHKDCISEVPLNRWNWRNLTVRWGGFIDHVDQFDAGFFNISPHEAELIDPQQRLFLQTAWKTIEDAGYTPSQLAALKTGLFVGVFNHDYAELLQQNEVMDAYLTTGTMNSMIANRISYILNLRGPSEAIDTACSSSLVAIHQAVHAILHDDCDMALAGGVNALITPTSFITAYQAGMLSEDGRCKTFDKNANGYVRGEGAGAILLKKLSQALHDGDHIYGVIKGSAVNHGGHVNTLTAPNPNAQAEVIISACQRARIPIDTLQYIETHGTGTPLGDPIEINGLKKAFYHLASAQHLQSLPNHYCGLGAVKTQIGHLESAAGIAGIIKTLLSMHHELIPANLHLNELNPYIELENSPFYLVDKPTAWPKVSGNPRRAGVSSFGFGGANAHIILEEPPEQTSIPFPNQSSYLICISAMTSSALHQRVTDLLHWLEKQNTSPSLAALSYTLNAGRQHFSKRICVLVPTVAELKTQLRVALASNEREQQLFAAELVTLDASLDLKQLAQNYLQGKTLDWQTIYGNFQERISLPGYPFAQESHWVESKKTPGSMHALIDGNSSTFSGSAFQKQFTGNEFYLREHLVNNEQVLPGALCLEMVRVAAHTASNNQQVTSLSHVIWKKPIKNKDLANPLCIRLFPETDAVSFSITPQNEETSYVQGLIHYSDNNVSDVPHTAISIPELKNALPYTQDPKDIYTRFKEAGITYGPSFQVIQALYYDADNLMAEIALPAERANQHADFVLHPCLLDGILHTTHVLLKKREGLYLPFSIAQLDIYHPLTNKCYVYASLASSEDNLDMPAFNIQVTDAAGALLLVITGFTLCAVAQIAPSEPTVASYTPTWVPLAVRASIRKHPGSFLILGNNEQYMQAVGAQLEGCTVSYQLLDHASHTKETFAALHDEWIIIALGALQVDFLSPAEIQKNLHHTYYGVHNLVTQINKLKPKHPVQLISLAPKHSIFSRALEGYIKCLHQEQSTISYRIIELDDLHLLADELTQEEIYVRYNERNQRYIKHYKPLPPLKDITQTIKKSGTYLITGGMGGLGYLFASYLAEHYQAKIVLTGRSPLSASYQEKIAELERKGGSVAYLMADVSSYEQVQTLIHDTKERFGTLNGIIHAAGLTQDKLIVHKTQSEIETVIAPKIYGACNLHAATLKEPLDFFILFSSVAAVFGNVGQSDYAYANCFLDEFACEREQQRVQGQCFGHTLSINWPLWEEGGLQIASSYQQELENNLGIISLSTRQGFIEFMQALQHKLPQYVVLPGYQQKLVNALQKNALLNPAISFSKEGNTNLQRETEDFLRKILAETLKCAPEKIKRDLPFENYGIDSLMIIQLNQRLAREFTALPKTLFFECQNLAALTQYFTEHFSNELVPLLSHAAPLSPMQVPQWNPARSGITPFANLIAAPRSLGVSKKTAKSEDIAIIGISGRYPQANDLTEFWHNLSTGKDSITEIPQERWAFPDYYEATQDHLGKMYSKWGGFLADVDRFDPLFFNISPREAALMDPQERLFLETAWKTIEDAGYARETLAGSKVGVYIGVMYGHYQLFDQQADSRQFVPTNSVFASIANRVSYFFDFHGPSMALDTMCSSSLTAIHLACQSIREGECDLALAGGVNLTLHPNKYLLLSHGKFLASDGHCRSFGEGGDGYVPGEGVGAVLLKRLEKAVEDGDLIYAVIKGSHLNHGGKTNGYTVPNPNAQAELLAETYQKANVDPAHVSYIEAHGTGTSLGDPIEIAALNKVFGKHLPHRCPIGSVKSNIGHCESAAGIAAVTKVVLQLKHHTLVPSLHSADLNPNIDWSSTPFRVQQSVSDWLPPAPYIARMAGISSFGAGGSNAHLILAEAPKVSTRLTANKTHYLLTLSAKTEVALNQRLDDLLVWLEKNPSVPLEQVSYTLNAGRTHFEWRCSLVASSLAQVVHLIQQFKAQQSSAHLFIQHSAASKSENSVLNSTLLPLLMHQLSQPSQYKETLLALAKIYVEGQDLDWEQIHRGESRKKISLPTYPFAKEHYWYSDAEQPTFSPEPNKGASPQNSLIDKVSSVLVRQVSQILNMTPHRLALEKNLGEYGMDSVHFIELAKTITEQYGVEFTPALFFTHSSILSISHYLINQFEDAVAQKHQQTTPLPVAARPVIPKHSVPAEVDAVAIIGMHGIFPLSEDLDAFWHHLVEGHDLVTEIPSERWDWRMHYGKEANQSSSRWGAFINSFDQFDAGFFNISAREANLMDPQQRLFLEIAWKTIEDAGYDPFALSSQNIGVFAGVEFSEYQTLIAKHQKEHHGFVATGNSHSMIANRVSYFFNFQGPSESIDTACSSSLVAIHRAVQAIRHGECNLAIAGGVSLILSPDTLIVTSQLGALSADGRCKTFDKTANGYVKGEGVAAILLKPLKQAQADGDYIYGVIKASAVNHGGKAQSLTAPNAAAQSELLMRAYSQANFSPDTVTFIETHGTGTALGDPVEIEGLKQAFNVLINSEVKLNSIALGSVKTNIGHLEPASGIAGVIKLLLAMHHETIPGILHLNEINPYINLTDTPFYIAKETQTWQRLKDENGNEIPLRAGVSSFGFGGTNAHVVLEEGRPYQNVKTPQVKPYYLIALSGKHQQSLQQKLDDLYQWLNNNKETVSLPSLSYTLNAGRAHFVYRCALVVDSIEGLCHALELLIHNEIPEFCMLNEGQSWTIQGPAFDEVYQAAIKALYLPENPEHYRHKLYILADLYTKHYSINWNDLYGGERITKLGSVPAYPFMKQRYWYDLEAEAIHGSDAQGTAVHQVLPIATNLSGQVLTYLQQVFAEKLRTVPESIQVEETYEVYGVDSLIGLEITNRLEKDFGTLPKTLLYERNRLKDLANYFIKNHHEKLPPLISPFQVVPTAASLEREEIKPVTSEVKPEVQPSCDIAIIGLNGTFPQANSLDEFWLNLSSGRDCVTEVPAERWNYKDYPVVVGNEEHYFPHGGFIPDVDKFDPLFFNISPRDAGLMDPQERLFMQSVWSTLEDAGYTRDKLKRKTDNSVGVFAGVTYNFYPLFIAEEWQKGNRVPLDIQSFSVANRISYFLDVHGPSFVVDTACSSSLAAIHLACDSILRGDCKMAIAGGVNLSLHPSKYHFLGSFNFMSTQGRCASFAEGGTGYVPSEGVGSVLLKPLAAAIADNDRIYGVIKGSSMNHGGKTSGYTVPNPNAQAAVILQTLKKANIDARTVSYIEAHGTGTALGDPIEIRGLQDAFEQYTEDRQFCAIGSVKSNIGHLESAAGISQLAKVLLQMHHQKLVPTLHSTQLNPFIDFKNSPFYVQQELTDWQPAPNAPRRAGISSFGAGGANVHMLIEEYLPKKKQQPAAHGPYIFLLSALNEERLAAQVHQMHRYLQQSPHTENKEWLRNACFTLQTGREHMPARLAVMVTNKKELLAALANYPHGTKPKLWVQYQVPNAIQPPSHLAELMSNGHYEELIHHWVNGAKVDWEQLYQRPLPDIISLPNYPFAKRRCWIPVKEMDTQPLPQGQPLNPPATVSPLQAMEVQEWLYMTHWEKKPHGTQSALINNEGKWLIFCDQDSVAALKQELGIKSAIFCFADEQFSCIHKDEYSINPSQKTDYERLFAAIHAAHQEYLTGVIYLCSENLAVENQEDPARTLLYLFQSIIGYTWNQQLLFCLASQSAQQVNSTDTVNMWQHHLWSMTRIFAAEQARYQVLLLDLDAHGTRTQQGKILAKELARYQPGQNHIAYRGTERYTVRFMPYPLPEHHKPHPSPTAPVAALITGGLGALGYELAEFLIAQGTRFILLTGTTQLSAHTLEKNTWLKQLETQGAQVHYAAVDVADKEQMQQVILKVEKEWQQCIDGVFHLAGITTDNVPLADMSEALWDEVLRVKIQGSLVLHELFLHTPLSRFVLFSSIAAVPHFGMAGLSAYAVANEFMNGLALYRRSQQLPASSINWVAWSEKGMSHRHNHDAFLDAVGMASVSIKKGIALFHALLSLNPAEITVCNIQWNKFLQVNPTAKQLDFFDYFVAEYAANTPTTVVSLLTPEEIVPLVLKLFASVLGLEEAEIDREIPFQQYGMDSISGIDYAEELGKHFPDVVAPMDLYRYPTLKQLTEYIMQRVQVNCGPTSSPLLSAEDIDLDQLTEAQLNELLELELKELELAYE